ncbi:rhodanese-like domain-containing protein [Loktanella sp. M215]|uniref:rhodanese-like domain-containing protein n=1 Tax=Loktanella sp. M215 TaxID=2675431 RepID=UPI001F325638|nr:rhodanese-like domain-containing protein [Loktanella sp. M215]MCF7698287.1 hypothetical protein [Loktanella sp. M215]
MVHTAKRLSLAETARAKTGHDQPKDVAARLAKPAVALDIRWPDDVAEDHVPHAINLCPGAP